jgi:nodulation protein E
MAEQARQRVVVTGMGIVCALGATASECWSALCAGRTGIGPIASTDVSELRFLNGAEVHGFRTEEHFEASRCDLIDRFAQFAVVAARQAVSQAGLELRSGNVSGSPFGNESGQVAVVTGTSMGGQTSLDRGFAAIYKQGRPRPHPFTIPLTMYNAGASQISMDLGITGPAFTISTACASATHAIGQAFWMVRSGAVVAAICGGSEAPFSPGILRAWEAMRVVTPDVCRPFSRDRRGLTLGEGGAMLLLESEEHAARRGAKVLGEVVGFGMSADAGHITQPTVDGPAAAMAAAMSDARIAAAEVGYINAHGTGTLANDATETQAIRQVFGAYTKKLAISSTKSMHGHALGAAGAIEAFATVMALREGLLPPTVSFNEADPECDIDVIPNIQRRRQVEFGLSNSFAFGGLNAVLAFRRWEGI